MHKCSVGGFARVCDAEALLGRQYRSTAAKSVAVFLRCRPLGGQLEPCFVLSHVLPGDQVFANAVAYWSHSDTNSKIIRKLRSDGPTSHDRLHLSNSTPAGLSWGSIWRLETTEEVSPPSLGEIHLGGCSGSSVGGPEAPRNQGPSVL